MRHATYQVCPDNIIKAGASAFVPTVDHPEHPNTVVMTSIVLHHNEADGTFVTRNTTYTPHKEQ